MKLKNTSWALLLLLGLTGCGTTTGKGNDAGADAGPPDAGQNADGGPTGAGSDAGQPADAGPSDAGSDAGIADAGDTWSNYAQGFFTSYCTSCHTVGASGDPTAGTGLDFTLYPQVQSNALKIQCGVAVTQDASWGCPGFPPAHQFPICNTGCTNPKPTATERDRLVAWSLAGMPQ